MYVGYFVDQLLTFVVFIIKHFHPRVSGFLCILCYPIISKEHKSYIYVLHNLDTFIRLRKQEISYLKLQEFNTYHS